MQRGEATVTVPLNNPVKKSTLKSILNQAGISAEELIEHL
jgi:predicted RNA binding protein YcfA (HicA-like mRNA interferase family)